MMIDVFAGLGDDGKPTFRREHPFLVFGARPKTDIKLTDLVEVDGRMRHVPRVRKTRTVTEVSTKTGLPRRVTESRSIMPSNPDTSRQVRRAMERRAEAFTIRAGA